MKLCRFDSEKGWKIVQRIPTQSLEIFRIKLESYAQNEPIWIASVRNEVSDVCKSLENIELVTTARLPQELINYKTPETLGVDRVLACIGAWSMEKKATLVLDCGSAVTIDLIDANGVFQGGLIAPGLQALRAGMESVTPQLPGADLNRGEGEYPAKSTTESVQFGTVSMWKEGVVRMVEQIQSDLKVVDEDIPIYLTGGDAERVRLKKWKLDPWLVVRGLKYVVTMRDRR